MKTFPGLLSEPTIQKRIGKPRNEGEMAGGIIKEKRWDMKMVE